MARALSIQTNFTAGQLSPRLLGRTDINRYYNGASELTNVLVQQHGGVVKRSGTKFVAESKDSSKACRLIEFQYSVTQTYILEFGHQYIRFYSNRAQVLNLGSPLEIASPYTESQLSQIRFIQSADVLYLCHPDIRPKELRRLSATSWQLVDYDYQDGPYLADNRTSTTLQPQATGPGTVQILASAAVFASTDIGRWVRIKQGSTWGAAQITAFNSATDVITNTTKAFAGGPGVTTWRLGAWSDTTGWPRVPQFFQDRLWFGGTAYQPDAVWASVTGDYANHQPSSTTGTVSATDGVSLTLADDGKVNAVYWMASTNRGLLVGTDGGETMLSSGSVFTAITPTNPPVAVRQGNHGSKEYVERQVTGDGAVMFVQRAGRKVRELVYSFEEDRFASSDLTLLAEDMTVGGVTDTAYQQEPNSILWLLRADGKLLACTYERDQQVVGWSLVKVGGAFGSGDAVVESIAVIADASGTKPVDQLWLVVKRTINGTTRRYVEYLEDLFDVDGAQASAMMVDSGIAYSGSATSTITGLSHLEGQTVSILADGAAHPDRVVSGGQVVLQVSATKASVGLPYSARVVLLPIQVVQAMDQARHKVRRVHRAHLMFHNTLGGKAGRSDDDLLPIPFRSNEAMGSPPPLFTGLQTLSVDLRHERDEKLYIVHDQPLPFTLLSTTLELDVAVAD